MTEIRLIHIEGKSYVDVAGTVAQAKKVLQTSNEVTLVARQTQITRIGMIIKTIEQQCGCKVTRLRNENKLEIVEDKQPRKDDKKEGNKEEKKEYQVLYFKATLTKN